ncbi:hypothetical protein ALC60_08848 [Trachymyrmex zeteki]|uniref:Uncharacterized protein n=1 Tax=Mycetomoellerius zeteki TaxID=64791 RepID=A0A151WWH3_9HYME|nr:hypothetical protein ALC60_08848 [Trachymyrmex zeteki]
MNKFAFQNNARQSHLPASLAAASSLLPLTRYPPRRTPIPRASLHSSPPPPPAPPERPSCHRTQTPAPVGQDRDETTPMVVAATEAGREKRSWFDRWNRSQFVMKGERNWTPWSRRVGAPSEYN